MNSLTNGFWLFAHDKEYFLSYKSFPWFKNKTINDITNIIEESPRHLYWPTLDVDLSYESIISHEKFPLTQKNITN